MSGLLNRMAKHALGTLDGVQPLVAPRYAPRPADVPGARVALDASFEIESSTPRETPRREPRNVHESAPETSFTQARPHPASIHPEAAPAQPASPAQSSEVAAIRPATAHAAEPETAPRAQAEPDTRVGGQEREHASSGTPTLSRLAREPQLNPIAPQETAAIPPAKMIPPSQAADPGRRQIEPLNLAAPEEAHPLRSSARTPPEHKLPQPSPRALAASPAEPGKSVESVESRTEIHITIGSIELRAPRPEPKAPRPPFRPRVSLEDFLHRRQEGRS